jgi:uncharacterized protein (TIGR02147 family)
MVNIFDFTNYREYLQKYYVDKKSINPNYSYQLLAQKAGIKNRGFVYNIIIGKAKLSRTNSFKLSKALSLTGREAQYFYDLVDFAQTKNEEERTFYLEKIEAARKSINFSLTPLEKEQFEYLSKWYHSVIRSLVELYRIGDDYEFLSEKIYPPLTIEQVKNSIELLLRLKIIRKDDNGIYHATGRSIRIGDDISRMVRKKSHVEFTELAKQSVIFSPSKLHLTSSLTLGISKKTYSAIREKTLKFKDEILELAHNDDKADRVYQFQLILFPLTNDKEE